MSEFFSNAYWLGKKAPLWGAAKRELEVLPIGKTVKINGIDFTRVGENQFSITGVEFTPIADNGGYATLKHAASIASEFSSK